MANAIIMAAGTASRFVPLSQECPKGLLEVRGEILIERQIRQLKEAGIEDITLVVGYKAEMFEYLKDKYGLSIVLNEDYYKFNNTSSLIRVIDKLDDTYICCSDHYFQDNVFMSKSNESFYSALLVEGKTMEYCLTMDTEDNITKVDVGGNDAWYMVGHVYFNREFSEAFRKIMIKEYERDETKQDYWEDVYIRYIDQLPKLKVNRYKDGEIQEFDSLDELRLFDNSYINDTRSYVIKQIATELDCEEGKLHGFKNIKGEELKFFFLKNNEEFIYENNAIRKC